MGDGRFGRQLREKAFLFDPAYTPLNHGSYGAYPQVVRTRQRELQDRTEAQSDPFIRFTIPKLLRESRETLAPLLGVSSKEVVFTPNATTGINTVLRNLNFGPCDVIIYLSTAYGACEKTILHVCETTPAECVRIDVQFPLEDGELVRIFRQAAERQAARQKRLRIAMFDTVSSFPGLRLPWERLVKACREMKILSLIDGAHGVGHIDLKGLGQIDPDFFTTNCHKWLYVPRPSAVLYVPSRNQHLIRTTFPTSHGFKPLPKPGDCSHLSQAASLEDPLGELFAWVATIDQSPYLCIPQALTFRSEAFGGEDQIRNYCFDLARNGGKLMADILQTEVMDNKTETLSQCCFTMVRLPLIFVNGHHDDGPNVSHNTSGRPPLDPEKAPGIVKWIMDKVMIEHNSWILGKFYGGAIWVRVSAQVYLELRDFEWAAQILRQLCKRVQAGEVL